MDLFLSQLSVMSSISSLAASFNNIMAWQEVIESSNSVGKLFLKKASQGESILVML